MLRSVPVYAFSCGLAVELLLVCRTRNTWWRRLWKKPSLIDRYNYSCLPLKHAIGESKNTKGEDELKDTIERFGIDFGWILENSSVDVHVFPDQTNGSNDFLIGWITIKAPYWNPNPPAALEPPQFLSVEAKFNGYNQDRQTHKYRFTANKKPSSSFNFTFQGHVKIYRRTNTEYSWEELLTHNKKSVREWALKHHNNGSDEALQKQMLTFSEKLK